MCAVAGCGGLRLRRDHRPPDPGDVRARPRLDPGLLADIRNVPDLCERQRRLHGRRPALRRRLPAASWRDSAVAHAAGEARLPVLAGQPDRAASPARRHRGHRGGRHRVARRRRRGLRRLCARRGRRVVRPARRPHAEPRRLANLLQGVGAGGRAGGRRRCARAARLRPRPRQGAVQPVHAGRAGGSARHPGGPRRAGAAGPRPRRERSRRRSALRPRVRQRRAAGLALGRQLSARARRQLPRGVRRARRAARRGGAVPRRHAALRRLHARDHRHRGGEREDAGGAAACSRRASVIERSTRCCC
mmetsp:Transcript_40030/g.132454  ORF Transcript_40030/g.132454 Transcript_40030/m.132454 type:complete len:304 (-) Transcript_40030:83-994(-)